MAEGSLVGGLGPKTGGIRCRDFTKTNDQLSHYLFHGLMAIR
jgi:hypothetical protein